MNYESPISNDVIIELERSRYDELLHKENHLEIILGALSKLSGYENIDELKKHLGIEERVNKINE